MIIIGEKLNSTLKAIRPAMENYDAAAIQDLAKRQFEAGATYIDLNAGMFIDDEPERTEWLVKTVNEVLDAPVTIDTPNPVAIERGLKANRKAKPMINSITDEKDRYDPIVPLIKEYNTSVVALCMDDTGMPVTVEDRMKIADRLIGKLTKIGMKLDDIYLDPMVRPIGTGSDCGIIAVETIRRVKHDFPEVHVTCGLSNISFGIPARKVMNQTFLVACIMAGMDSAILDPLDKKLMTFLYAAEALAGVDEYCTNYLMKFREGALEV